MQRVTVSWSKALKFNLAKIGEDIPHLNGFAPASTIKRTKRG